MIKQPITSDAARLSLLCIAAAYINEEGQLVNQLSERLRRRLTILDKTFGEDLVDLDAKENEKYEKLHERNRLMRLLVFAIRDAQMGLIRRARRNEMPPECLNTYLIPEQRDRISITTNQSFELARDLIGHNQRYEESLEITNPTIAELIDRLSKVEACSWEADTAKSVHNEAQSQAAWGRTQVIGVIRQLNYELNYLLRKLTRQDRMEQMKRFGFRWV